MRALAIFVAGMALLLAVDLATEPRGLMGQDRAIESALSSSNQALWAVADPEIATPPDDADGAERRERARSTAFFIEQANLAWRRGEQNTREQIKAETGGAAALAFLGKLWMLGWLLLPVGALAARLACPRTEGRDAHWALLFAARSLGIASGFIAVALLVYGLGAAAPIALAPLVSALVVLNAWLLSVHAQIGRAATLLRLAPLLILICAALMVARQLLFALGLIA